MNVALRFEEPLGIERGDKEVLIRIPHTVHTAIGKKWKDFRTIIHDDLPSIQQYWQDDANRGHQGLPSAPELFPFALSSDVTGDTIPEVFLPARHRNDPCRWKIIAVHTIQGGYELYEVASDQEGTQGPCVEGKPWYGFALTGTVGGVSVTHVSSSCAVATFTWSDVEGYVER